MTNHVGQAARRRLRGLARSPSFTLVALLTLAIGIGATTAVFSVVDGVLLKPLPYPEPDELVAVWHDAPGAPGLAAAAGGLQLSPSMFVTYQDENRSFEQVGVWSASTANVTGFAEPEQVHGRAVDERGCSRRSAFRRCSAAGSASRTKTRTGRASRMLTYGYWQERFGGDPERRRQAHRGQRGARRKSSA